MVAIILAPAVAAVDAIGAVVDTVDGISDDDLLGVVFVY